MKILSPLSNIEEIRPLCDAGADQFYCGLINKNEALNDRPNTSEYNFNNVEELLKAVKIASSLGKDIFLAINNLTPHFDKAIQQAKIAEEVGIKGVIISNPLLMKRMREEKLRLEICVSCLTGVLNSQGVDFFKKLGAEIIHFPRHIGIRELEMISKKVKGIKLSVFGLNGMCINIESYCSLHFLKREHFRPCIHFETIKIKGDNYLPKTFIDKKINSPDISCGICAFKKLKEIGIDSIKIEGRELPIDEKIRNVVFVKKAINMLKENIDNKEYQSLCRHLFKRHFQKDCKSEYCYF